MTRMATTAFKQGLEDAEVVQGRLFSRRVYWLSCLFDLFARSTWVLTLMPITVISRNLVGRTVLVSVISSIEIIRRSVWAVLRIENEQVNNTGGFRTLLWVPSKLTGSSIQASKKNRRRSAAGVLAPETLRLDKRKRRQTRAG